MLLPLTSTQLRDETWILRNRVKRLSVRLVDTAYGLHPDASTLTASSDPKVVKAARARFIKERVASLLQSGSPYLKSVYNVRRFLVPPFKISDLI